MMSSSEPPREKKADPRNQSRYQIQLSSRELFSIQKHVLIQQSFDTGVVSYGINVTLNYIHTKSVNFK